MHVQPWNGFELEQLRWAASVLPARPVLPDYPAWEGWAAWAAAHEAARQANWARAAFWATVAGVIANLVVVVSAFAIQKRGFDHEADKVTQSENVSYNETTSAIAGLFWKIVQITEWLLATNKDELASNRSLELFRRNLIARLHHVEHIGRTRLRPGGTEAYTLFAAQESGDNLLSCISQLQANVMTQEDVNLIQGLLRSATAGYEGLDRDRQQLGFPSLIGLERLRDTERNQSSGAHVGTTPPAPPSEPSPPAQP